MARNRDDLADSLNTEAGRGLFGLVAEEEDLDRRALWRLGSWAVGSIAALVLAIMVSQSSIQGRQDQGVAGDLARQAQQIQRLTKEAQAEVTRLGAAIETLNGDRDRLFSRVTVVEQHLESVTGSIARQVAAFKPQSPTASAAAESPAAAQPPQPAAKAGPPPATVPAETDAAHKTSRDAAPRSAPATTAGHAAATAPPAIEAPPPKPAPAATAPSPAEQAPEKIVAEAPPAKPMADPASLPAKPPPQALTSKSMLAPPDPSAGKLLEPPTPPAAAAAAPAEPTSAAVSAAPPSASQALAALPVVASTAESDAAPPLPLPSVPTQRTEFGIDLGGANSLDGLRSIWQRLTKANKTLGALQPIVMVKERGAGMQLRLVAGPIEDAATAAKLCAGMAAANYFCETTLYDGQRLSMPAPRPIRKRTSNSTSRLPPPEPEAPPPPLPPPQASAPPPQQPHSALLSLLGVH
uniref:SPOR domain-containing protein n=1 Tax=Rhodopseudomonas palustris (strain BisA53) TaxID=316055 RepID=Q07MW3_RHOP5